MSSRFKTVCLTGIVLMGWTGCELREVAELKQHESPVSQTSDGGITYRSKKGLHVSMDTAKIIGLETVEVAERPIHTTQELTARIYRTATTREPFAFASVLVSATDAAALRPGLTSVRASTAQFVTVLKLDRSAQPQTGMVEAILQVSDAEGTLAEGGTITACFPTGSTQVAAAVPRESLVRTKDGDFVFTANGDFFVRTAVKLGGVEGDFVEVIEGLYAGDKVVARPVMTLWMTELHHVNGGNACCAVSKPKD